MATKTAEKKTTKKQAPPAAVDPVAALAQEVLSSRLHRTLVRLGEPARIPEIIRELNDDLITAALARRTMELQPLRFVAVDRRWDIAQRYLNAQRPQERTLEELIANYGAALPATDVAGELAHIYGRSRSHFEDVAPRLLRGPQFFQVSDGLAYGLRSWLLDLNSEKEDDVLFYNFLSRALVSSYEQAAAEADWVTDPLGSASRIIAAAHNQPVDNRLIQYFAWRALGEDFDALALYDLLHAHSDIFLPLPDHRWLLSDALEPLRTLWETQASEVVDLLPEDTIAMPVSDAEAVPLSITSDDLDELVGYISGREDFVTLPELLVNVLEIPAASPTFPEDTEVLLETLRAHTDQFQWVGTDRFHAPNTIPPYLGQLPESLTFPTLPRFETADGEILDQMLAETAFEDSLAEDVLDPVAQDVNDQEPSEKNLWPEGMSADSQSLRLVLKAHHKEIGTFPLSQIPFGFFPTEPQIVELTFEDASGTGHNVYVDYNVQLIYGLFDLYADIAADSGAVLHLKKTDHPAVYRFLHSNETDSSVFISPSRLEELSEFRSEAESSSISTYDIVRRVLDHYRKGTSFLTLLTEVNIVRRTPRRLIASILSGYHAFHPRANRWTFDSKKEPEGFDHSKSSFLLR